MNPTTLAVFVSLLNGLAEAGLSGYKSKKASAKGSGKRRSARSGLAALKEARTALVVALAPAHAPNDGSKLDSPDAGLDVTLLGLNGLIAQAEDAAKGFAPDSPEGMGMANAVSMMKRAVEKFTKARNDDGTVPAPTPAPVTACDCGGCDDCESAEDDAAFEEAMDTGDDDEGNADDADEGDADAGDEDDGSVG